MSKYLEVYHSRLEKTRKSKTVASFAKTTLPLRIVITTVAFGMGIDCPKVRLVFHFCAPEDIDTVLDKIIRTLNVKRRFPKRLLKKALIAKC